MVNKLSEKGIAIASAVLTGIWYILCFVIVIVLKENSYKLFNLFFHGIDLSKIATNTNIINGIIGFIIIVVFAYVCGYVFASIYNKYAK